MSVFTILVEFRLDPADMPAFMPLMLANARTSLADEEGCERFDVLTPAGETGRIVLYEIYSDRAAFEIHCASAHFKVFDEATRVMVRGKVVTVLDMCGDSAGGGTS